MQGSVAIRVFHIGIGSTFHKRSGDFCMTMKSGYFQGRIKVIIVYTGVSVCAKKHFDYLRMTFISRKVQGRLTTP